MVCYCLENWPVLFQIPCIHFQFQFQWIAKYVGENIHLRHTQRSTFPYSYTSTIHQSHASLPPYLTVYSNPPFSRSSKPIHPSDPQRVHLLSHRLSRSYHNSHIAHVACTTCKLVGWGGMVRRGSWLFGTGRVLVREFHERGERTYWRSQGLLISGFDHFGLAADPGRGCIGPVGWFFSFFVGTPDIWSYHFVCLLLGSSCWWCLDCIVGIWCCESLNLWKIKSVRSRIIFTSLVLFTKAMHSFLADFLLPHRATSHRLSLPCYSCKHHVPLPSPHFSRSSYTSYISRSRISDIL